MRKSRYLDQQIALGLQQVEQGASVAGVCRKLGISEPELHTNCRARLHRPCRVLP
jgi:putative transposase